MHTQPNNALPHTRLDPTSASYGIAFAAYGIVFAAYGIVFAAYGITFAGMLSASKSKQRA
jgi:hypothetical protein